MVSCSVQLCSHLLCLSETQTTDLPADGVVVGIPSSSSASSHSPVKDVNSSLGCTCTKCTFMCRLQLSQASC